MRGITARQATGLLAAAALTVGCAASSAPALVSPPTRSSAPTGLPSPHSGLVGAIDAARLLTVCENVRLASEAAAGGLTDDATQALAAARTALREGPTSSDALSLAAREQRAEKRGGVAAGLRVAERWCG